MLCMEAKISLGRSKSYKLGNGKIEDCTPGMGSFVEDCQPNIFITDIKRKRLRGLEKVKSLPSLYLSAELDTAVASVPPWLLPASKWHPSLRGEQGPVQDLGVWKQTKETIF